MEQDSKPLIMSIKTLYGTNIKGSKSAPNTFIRVQFADFDFKDTAVVSDNANPEYNSEFEQTFNVDENLINAFTSKAIIFTVNEALPKDKSAILGTGELSLFKKFLHYFDLSNYENIPECPLSVTQTIPITYLNPKLLVVGQDLPSITVVVSLSRPLLRASDLQSSVFLCIQLEDVRPVPEEWSLKDGNEKDPQSNLYTYCASIKLPGVTEEPKVLFISGGTLCMLEDSSPADLVQNLPRTISIIDEKSESKNEGCKNPSLKQPTDKLHEGKGIKWNTINHFWLGPTVLNKIRSEPDKKLELEFFRVPQAKFSGFSDAASQRCRAKAMIDLRSCLNPTVIGIKGRYFLESAELSFDNDKVKKADPYKLLGSSISIKLGFSSPLIRKIKLSETVKPVQDFVSKRYIPADVVYKQRSAQVAIEYKGKIKELINQLIGEYREAMRLESNLENSSKGLSQAQILSGEHMRKPLFIYHLNKNGTYFDMKEKLKLTVVQIVREKFRQKSPFEAKAELQSFLSNIYVFLTEEMQSVLNEMHAGSTLEVRADAQTNYYKLKIFAEEAEWNQNIDKAGKIYREQIANCNENLSCWFDYSTFCFRNNFEELGLEALNEVIGRDDKFVKGLIAHAMISFSKERFEETRTFLLQAISLDPKNVVVNCMMGIFQDALNDVSESTNFLTQAEFLSKEKNIKIGRHFLETAEFAIMINCGPVADKALAMEILHNPSSSESHLLFAKFEAQRGRLNNAESTLKTVLDVDKTEVNALVALGHVYYMQKKYSEAKAVYEFVLTFQNELSLATLESVYIRMGDMHLNYAYTAMETGDIEFLEYAMLAKNMYLEACKENKGRSQSWIGVGKSCFVLKEYQTAEEAFCEANYINNKDGETWAHIALLCLAENRFVEADQAISQALRLQIKDNHLLRHTGKAFFDANRLDPASMIFKVALAENPKDEELNQLYQQAKSDEIISRVSGLAM